MTVLNYSFDKFGCYTTAGEDFFGHEGDHNAIVLKLSVDPELCPNASYFRLLFESYASAELLPDENGVITYPVPDSLTRSGALTFQLAGIKANGGEVKILAKTNTVTLPIKPSLEGEGEPNAETLNVMEGYIASSKQAIEDARQEAEKAKLYKISAAHVDENGHLQISYADGTEVDAGSVIGPKGDVGEYILPVASGSVLGGIKVGNGLVMDTDSRLRTEEMTAVTTYEVDTPAWAIQPALVSGDASALKLWNENYYFARFTETAGEFILLELEGKEDSAVRDSLGNVLTFRFADGTYSVGGNEKLYNGCPVDVISLSAGAVLRFAGVSSVKHYPKLRQLYGVAPNIIEVNVTAGVFIQRFNAVNLVADYGNNADTVEFQCDTGGKNGVHIAKANTLSRASLLIYDISSFTKKFGSVRLNVKFDATGGNIWNAVLDGMLRQSDDGSAPADSATALANTFHRTIKQTGFINPPTRNACEDITSINYSSVRGKIDIRNGSVITIKERRI